MPSDWIDKQYCEVTKLAEERFAPLGAAERKMLRAAIAGDIGWCGPTAKHDDPRNKPSSNEEWDSSREIRAEVLRWLCTDKTAETYVDSRGVRVHGAKISGLLDLSNVSVRFPLVLAQCRIADDIWMRSAKISSISLEGSCVRSIRADSVTTEGSILLCTGFVANGSILLPDASIGGGLSCNLGTFQNPIQQNMPESGVALTADRAKVKGSIHLRGSRVEGLVRLVGAHIDGNLSCTGGIFRNPRQGDTDSSGIALLADSVTAKGGVFLNDGFSAEGGIRMVGAQIERILDCQGGTFKNPPQEHGGGDALMVDGSFVKGNVALRNGFKAEGAVALVGVRIEGIS